MILIIYLLVTLCHSAPIIIISDTHIHSNDSFTFRNTDGQIQNPNQNTRNILQEIQTRYPGSWIIHTGDTVFDELSDPYGYLRAREILYGKAALFALGNHDNADYFCQVWFFSNFCSAWNFRLTYSVDASLLGSAPGWQAIFLDSRFNRGSTQGAIGQAQLNFIATTVRQRPQDNYALFVHHDPTLADNEGVIDSVAFNQMLSVMPNIKVIFKGHRHEGLAPVGRVVDVPSAGYKFQRYRNNGHFLGYLKVDLTSVVDIDYVAYSDPDVSGLIRRAIIP